MSRFTTAKRGVSVTWGVDHITGLFIQVFEEGKEEPEVDLDMLNYPKLTTDMIERIAWDYGIELTINQDNI